MKGNTATIYARQSQYGDVAIYKTKPVVKKSKTENYFGDFDISVKPNPASEVFGDDITALIGTTVPEDRTVKITIKQSKTAKKGQVLFAAKTNGIIDLLTTEPTFVTEKEERWSLTGMSRVKVTRLRDNDTVLASFCAGEFRKATGLKLLKNTATRLVVTAKTLGA